MKQLLVILFTTLASATFGQDKNNYVLFNKLKEIKGTTYVIASIENWGKMYDTQSKHLLFINTSTGQSKRIDFPRGGYIEEIEQVKIDSFGINLIIVGAHTVDLDGKKGVDWNDPKQVIIISTDGTETTQLTDSSFFTKRWTVNSSTATLVVTGYFDSNGNFKYDRTDKSEIHIYDLRSLKLIKKL